MEFLHTFARDRKYRELKVAMLEEALLSFEFTFFFWVKEV